MDYLDRLIRRAFAQPLTETSTGITDPFIEHHEEQVVWPEAHHQVPAEQITKGSKKASKKSYHEKKGHNDKTSLTPTQHPIVDSKVEQPMFPQEKLPDPHKVILDADSTTTYLNKEEGITLIDQIIQPHIDAGEENLKQIFQEQTEELPVAITPVTEAQFKSRTNRDLTDSKAELREGLVTQEIQPLVPSVEIATQNRTQELPLEATDKFSALQQQVEKIENRTSEKIRTVNTVTQEQKVIVLNRGSDEVELSANATGGDPHFGIRQL